MKLTESRINEIVERARKQPKPQTKQMSMVLTATRHQGIKEFCDSRDITIVNFFNSILDELGIPK